MATRQRVKITDVAADAGVSRSTVSLVLQGNPVVAEATRERVLDSVQRLGYVYNRGAASLRTQRSHTIGLVITTLTNPFFAELAAGVESQLDEASYVALLGSTSDALGRQEQLLATMQEHRTDGILLCPTSSTPIVDIERIQRQTPLVLFVRYLDGVDVDYVGADNVSGAALAIEHLIERGHQRIAFIGGSAISSARRDRLAGYQQALAHHGLAAKQSLMPNGSPTRETGHAAVRQLLRLPHPPTAALCYNDVVAFGVMLGLQESGMAPGRDFAVVGFDDVADAALWRPSLTTVSLDAVKIGQIAAERILARIADRQAPPVQEILPSKLVVRRSS